jgi:hypothetical protein
MHLADTPGVDRKERGPFIGTVLASVALGGGIGLWVGVSLALIGSFLMILAAFTGSPSTGLIRLLIASPVAAVVVGAGIGGLIGWARWRRRPTAEPIDLMRSRPDEA